MIYVTHGINYLWDTNTSIYYLEHLLTIPAKLFLNKIIKEKRPAISSITEIELLSWKFASADDIQILRRFISESIVFELDKDIKEKTAEIRRNYSLKLPDAIIAATALVNNLTLISRNSKDFKKVEEVKLINPYEL